MLRKVLLLLLLMPLCVLAAPDRFEARVPVENRQAEEQDAVLRQALEQVLVRMTGRTEAVQQPAVQQLLENPRQYLQRYRYETGDEEQYGLWLVVQFDGASLRRQLAERGVPVWAEDAPAVLMWVAARDGAERYLVGADERAELRQPMQNTARQMGLQVLFPLLDLEDRAAIRISDVWGGFSDSVLEAARRYGVPAVVSARLDQDPAGRWEARWQLYLSGEPQQAWISRADTRAEALRHGVAALAGRLAQDFTLVPGRAVDGLRLRVEGVRSAADYAWLQQRLLGLAGVKQAQVEAVDGPVLALRLGLEVDAGRVLRALDGVERLRALPVVPGEPQDPGYRLLP